MKSVARIIGLILSFIIVGACGYYVIEDSFRNIIYGSVVTTISTVLILINTMISIYFLWNYKVEIK